MTAEDLERAPPSRRRGRDPLALVVAGAAIVLLALGFAWPWRSLPPPGGPTLSRYVPVHHGETSLAVRLDVAGAPISWESENVTFVPAINIFTDLPAGQRDIIDRFYTLKGETLIPAEATARFEGVRVIRLYGRELDSRGTITDRTTLFLREPRGQFLVSLSDPATGDLLFDPPLLLLPADFDDRTEWESSGRLNDVVDYTASGRVVAAGPFERTSTTAGPASNRFDDCRQVELSLHLANAGAVLRTSSQTWYCAGFGAVESKTFGADGVQTEHRRAVAGDHMRPAPGSLPPPPAAVSSSEQGAGASDAPGDPATWQLTRVGRVLPVGVTGESTIPPTWIPSDPPLLLAAAHSGPLVAFEPNGSVRWRFFPEGTIYSPPAFDAARGRLYVGASDRRLYALDVRGLFLWSVTTGDNVATRPVVAGDTVVFGSEDRLIYGVDAETGAVRWAVPTGGAVVSDPVLIDAGGPLVVIGSDDGGVYALDPATGTRRWLYVTDMAVEAPIVLADGTLYVASRDGTVSALDPATGKAHWVGQTGLGSQGNPVRTAVAVGPDAVFVVERGGSLTAFDRATGRQLWIKSDPGFLSGPPVVVGQTIIVAAQDGSVVRFGLDGEPQGVWSAAEVTLPTDSAPAFYLGAAPGGNAIWLADGGSVIYRLGPAAKAVQAGPAPLAMAWNLPFTDPPFHSQGLFNSPIPYGDKLVVMELSNQFALVDPPTGKAVPLGRVGRDAGSPATDPTIADNVLLTVADSTLYATALPSGRPLWAFEGTGNSEFPVTVAGETVLWLAPEGPPAAGETSAVLSALDLTTGALQWQVATRGAALVGGVVAGGDAAFITTPPTAFDLKTGAVRWRADLAGFGRGGPALSDSGDTLFVALANSDGGDGSVAALDTSDGRVRWQASLGAPLTRFEELRVSSGTVIVPLANGAIVGLATADGSERWRVEPPVARFGGIIVEGDRVWVVLQNAHIFALDAQTGARTAEFTTFEFDIKDTSFTQRPAVVGNHLVVPIGVMLLGFEIP